MNKAELAAFVRSRGLGVVASRGPSGSPQAALVGLAATDRGELVFDCSRDSRKYVNIAQHPEVAIVIGWTEEVTVQVEGLADILSGENLERCRSAYIEQHPGGRDRAGHTEIAHIRVTPRWLRYSDFRPETFGSTETTF